MSAGTRYNPNAIPKTVIFCCNSIGQPYGLVGNVSFPNIFAAAWENQGDTVIQYVGPANTPNPCDSITDTITNYATTIGLYTQAKTGRPLLVILPNCGSSDVLNGGDTAAQIYTKIQTLVGMIHTDGGKVLVGNICPGSYYTAGAVETRRTDTNTLIESDLTLWDYFWPMAATHSADLSTLFGADNQHWSPLGHIVAAAEVMLAQDGYYRNGSATPLRANNILLTPTTDNDKAVWQVNSASSTVALSAGIYDPSLPSFGALWYGTAAPSNTNYALIGDGASLVLNASGQHIFRIAHTEVARINSGGLQIGAINTGTPVSKWRHGTATLVTGTKTVSDTNVTANTRILVTRNGDGGTIGCSYSITRSAGSSFTITSKDKDGATQAADTSVMAYELIEP
jgi:hypothetical protein